VCFASVFRVAAFAVSWRSAELAGRRVALRAVDRKVLIGELERRPLVVIELLLFLPRERGVAQAALPERFVFLNRRMASAAACRRVRELPARVTRKAGEGLVLAGEDARARSMIEGRGGPSRHLMAFFAG
jgi:hypothetical protein